MEIVTVQERPKDPDERFADSLQAFRSGRFADHMRREADEARRRAVAEVEQMKHAAESAKRKR